MHDTALNSHLLLVVKHLSCVNRIWSKFHALWSRKQPQLHLHGNFVFFATKFMLWWRNFFVNIAQCSQSPDWMILNADWELFVVILKWNRRTFVELFSRYWKLFLLHTMHTCQLFFLLDQCESAQVWKVSWMCVEGYSFVSKKYLWSIFSCHAKWFAPFFGWQTKRFVICLFSCKRSALLGLIKNEKKIVLFCELQNSFSLLLKNTSETKTTRKKNYNSSATTILFELGRMRPPRGSARTVTTSGLSDTAKSVVNLLVEKAVVRFWKKRKQTKQKKHNSMKIRQTFCDLCEQVVASFCLQRDATKESCSAQHEHQEQLIERSVLWDSRLWCLEELAVC